MSPFTPVLAALIGGVIAIFGIYLKGWLDKKEQEQRTTKIVWAEFDDIARHYNRNVARLRTMQFFLAEKSMWPDINHLEKLKWPEDTYIFSDDSVKFSDVRNVRSIYKMRLRLRNANLDADAALRAYTSDDKKMLGQVLDFVEQRHRRIEDLALEFTGRSRKGTELTNQEERAAFENTKDMLFYQHPIVASS